MNRTIGAALRRAREVRVMSAVEAARAAGISAAYLSKLEHDAVKRPSPPVLHRLSQVLSVPYTELMRLSGYHVPDPPDPRPATVDTTLFADLTVDERDELLEYLAWYRARQRTGRVRSGNR